jgi:hypothetical protein
MAAVMWLCESGLLVQHRRHVIESLDELLVSPRVTRP